MSAESAPTPDDAKLTATYMGMPNWEEVKHTIYGYWVETNYWLYQVNRLRLQEPHNSEFGSPGINFKAALLRLYHALRSKLSFHEKDTCVIELRVDKRSGKPRGKGYSLDDYVLKPSDLTFLEAVNYFILLTDFCEADGITHFENKKIDPEHGFTGDLTAR